jgi:hypothetical protein
MRIQWQHHCLLVKITIDQGLVGRSLALTEECELPNEFLYTFASQLPMFGETFRN